MKLTDPQLKEYDEKGFIEFRDLFTKEEVQALQRDADMLATPQRGHPDANVIEKDGTTLRSAWAPEIDSPACAAAHRLPRILGPIQQLMGEDIYLYQSRLNYKRAFTGDVFQWHQDYQAWRVDKIMRGGHREILSVLIMLDDTYNIDCGPLQFLPGSHREGFIQPIYDTQTTSYALHCVDDKRMEEIYLKKYPVHTCFGPAGTVVIFAATLIHGSGKNKSAQGRRNLYFAYNKEDNKPVDKSGRKHANNWIQNPHQQRLAQVEDDALRKYARQAVAV
jgi:ectoine hydroxylase